MEVPPGPKNASAAPTEKTKRRPPSLGETNWFGYQEVFVLLIQFVGYSVTIWNYIYISIIYRNLLANLHPEVTPWNIPKSILTYGNNQQKHDPPAKTKHLPRLCMCAGHGYRQLTIQTTAASGPPSQTLDVYLDQGTIIGAAVNSASVRNINGHSWAIPQESSNLWNFNTVPMAANDIQ